MTTIWPWYIRAFHWLLVVAILGAYLSAENDHYTMHEVFGTAVLVLTILRILIGFSAIPYIRFADFIRHPREVASYIKQGRHAPIYKTHNPLGGYMVLFFLIALPIHALIGMTIDNGEFVGMLATFMPLWWFEIAEDAHEAMFNIILAAIIVHILAVVFYQVVRKQPLIKAMITGKK